MTEFKNTLPDSENGDPLNPLRTIFYKVLRRMYDFLASVKLAIALLIIILVCCVAGVTVVRGVEAGALIFGTIWFNGLLVLLVVNVAFCFFGRIWGRKMTIISLGMILFHLCFVAMLCGIIYNSLFYFRGVIRLTEGETLPIGDPQSYDYGEHGRLFSFSKLKGEIILVKMHRDYIIDGANKRAAYEIVVVEGGTRKQDIIYITNSMVYKGIQYLNEKEGYSVAIVLTDKQGRELYGAFVPLQSYKQKDEKGDDVYLYTTGTKEKPGSFPFPQDPLSPLLSLQVTYRPSVLKFKERDGDAFFQVWPLESPKSTRGDEVIASGKVPIGAKMSAGNHSLEAREVRYWVGINVRYEPGKPFVLASLWVGLGGMILTFIGRMRRIRK